MDTVLRRKHGGTGLQPGLTNKNACLLARASSRILTSWDDNCNSICHDPKATGSCLYDSAALLESYLLQNNEQACLSCMMISRSIQL